MVLNSLIFIALATLWWYHASRRRDHVLVLLRRWCRSRGFTLLDDTVVWRGWKRQRNSRTQWYWVYDFEISTDGLQRTNGHVLLDNSRHGRAWLSVDDGNHQLYETLSE